MDTDPEPEEDDDEFPPDFDLPFEPHPAEDATPSIIDLLSGNTSILPNGETVLSPEDFIIVASMIELYSAYISYVKEMDPDMHRRAVGFSSDTADLHPDVILTDLDGNTLRGWVDPEDTEPEGPGADI